MLDICIGFAWCYTDVDISMHNIGLDQVWEACEEFDNYYVINGFILEHWS
jgi:hypothetical protein